MDTTTATPTSDPREDKLPSWAKEALTAARAEAREATARLAAHLATIEPSPIWYGDWQNKIYIPTHGGGQTVNFSTIGKPVSNSSYEISAYLRPSGVLHISGGSSVIIKPLASNCFDVVMDR